MRSDFAIIINESPERRRSAVVRTRVANPDLEVIFAKGDIVVLFTQGGRAVVRPDVIVLGHLFSKTHPPKLIERFVDHERLSPGDILRSYWGSYIAMFPSEDGRTCTILRDPSAFMPCYYCGGPGEMMLASNAPLLCDACGHIADVDWQKLGRHLAMCVSTPEDTCLAGVGELIRGCSLTIDDKGFRIHVEWSPWSFTSAQSDLTAPMARDLVREAIMESVGAWASCYKKIIVLLSGGLDSSVVAAALAEHGGSEIHCLSLATDDPSGDETRYAKAVADSLQLTFIPGRYDLEGYEITRTVVDFLPRPGGRIAGHPARRECIKLAASHGIDAIFDGGGGDSVFCYRSSVVPFSDRLLVEGPGMSAFQTARDIHWMTRASLLEVIWRGVRRAYWQAPSYRWVRDVSFLKPRQWEAYRHPWLETPSGALPGKAAHIASLVFIHNFGEGVLGWPTTPCVSPLLSQPVLETCLRIPSWLWCSGGVNRALVREAFANDLPHKIMQRRWKGGKRSKSPTFS
ncbi:asparagine synthase C-terminal domain-containing protein [Sphingobium sp.]|uniref:asparagine synthase-related protein n=1 Tax=Sphingobium sp. TaxID=1912891 RepID=UPI000DB73972|nr:asparagine synthase C-terminal domain-containing protein [Sphingobium sp.]PZU68658.1 MAG: hypothetical protein DI540_07870 [Sphingobium sp.]